MSTVIKVGVSEDSSLTAVVQHTQSHSFTANSSEFHSEQYENGEEGKKQQQEINK